jgi:hypothetical protein
MSEFEPSLHMEVGSNHYHLPTFYYLKRQDLILDVFLHFSLLIKPYNKTTQGARNVFYNIFLTMGYKIWLGGGVSCPLL